MNIVVDMYKPEDVMTAYLWNRVKHFKSTEAWGNPMLMRVHLIYWLDAFRNYINKPIIIHCGHEEEGHLDGSQHYIGNATDFHIPDTKAGDMLFELMRFPFTGIGYYPYWNNPGFHVDMKEMIAGLPRRMWYRDKKGSYHNLTHENACVIMNMM